jgi:hypothetical protein
MASKNTLLGSGVAVKEKAFSFTELEETSTTPCWLYKGRVATGVIARTAEELKSLLADGYSDVPEKGED